jgi:DNA mismatch repair protein MutS
MKVTPMMEQYFASKEKHPDAILFFRMGDFYEMFFDDAVTVSRELDLTLTARNKGESNETPMAGVPHHAADGYIARLVEKGYKVAVCDQLEAPSAATKIVRRGVTRVVTPGVNMDPEHLDSRNFNFLAAVCASTDSKRYGFGLALVDATTGEFRATELADLGAVLNELGRMSPRELLVPQDEVKLFAGVERQVPGLYVQALPAQNFDRKQVLRALEQGDRAEDTLGQAPVFAAMGAIRGIFGAIEGYNFQAPQPVERAVAGVLSYLTYAQRGVLGHVDRLECYRVEDFLILDDATRANLELTETLMGGKRKGSLVNVLDETVTAMGARRLRAWLVHPLVDVERITRRHDAVGELRDDLSRRQNVRENMRQIQDIERLIGRLSGGSANARDLLGVRRTLEAIGPLKAALEGAQSELLRVVQKRLDPCETLCALLERAIREDAPTTIRDGGIIKKGFYEELDEIQALSNDAKDWLLRYETRERERTGISSLKVKYNRVFGYFMEITRANFHLVPEDYIRKGTLANAERFITEDLKEYEEKILTATDRSVELEARLFEEIRQEVVGYLGRLRQTAFLLSSLDCLASLAETAAKHNFCRPEMDDGETIDILDGRHPVVERALGDERFVPNSVKLDCAESQLLIITGPNMAGKSTIIRQVALISLMAQMGSFVPAASARLGVVDKIFSRVGASDNLARGQSTFMVEMTETAHILREATARSLIILDEIGRGTSTYDGLSIAWSVAEFLHDRIGAKTLFATHYHELTTLSDAMRGVQNFNVACKEHKEDVIFLRKMIPGPANRSYGIQVGRLAGLPEAVVARAKEILHNLERTARDITHEAQHSPQQPAAESSPQLNLLAARAMGAAAQHSPPAAPAPAVPEGLRETLDELRGLDISTTTPLEALNLIYKLQRRLKEA